MNGAFTITLVICAVLFAVMVATFVTVLPKDSAQNEKILIVVTVFSIAVSLVAYGLALWHFSNNAMYMAQFLLAFCMLVLLPAALISTAISTVSVSNLRDAVAARAGAGAARV